MRRSPTDYWSVLAHADIGEDATNGRQNKEASSYAAGTIHSSYRLRITRKCDMLDCCWYRVWQTLQCAIAAQPGIIGLGVLTLTPFNSVLSDL